MPSPHETKANGTFRCPYGARHFFIGQPVQLIKEQSPFIGISAAQSLSKVDCGEIDPFTRREIRKGALRCFRFGELPI
jgi:hypothetical protein